MNKRIIVRILMWWLLLFPTLLMGQVPSKLTILFRYEQQLNLTKEQIADLKTQVMRLDSLKTVSNPDTNKFIKEQLVGILNPRQYQEWGQIVRMAEASYWTKLNWQLLKESGLVQNTDSAKLYLQNFRYEINKASALERAVKSKPEYAGLIRDSILTIRPLILLKLDAYRNRLPKWSPFVNVFMFRKELDLRDDQIDSLISQFNKVQIIKLFNKVSHQYDNAYFKKTEFERILNILGIEKIERYLFVKAQNQVMDKSKADWQSLQKYGLSKGLDSVKVFKEIQEYELKLLIAQERLALNNTQKNVFDKKDIEDNRPRILKDLEQAIATKNMSEKF
ncbi:hypothetical protein HDC90_000141 [Pedobacter sp. AK013]|uniref:hypothetical protein n=1 Tax=Pedobacter sp. AK013 TaxID=2723071 RepID=UPI00161491AA|nr:hypothetical protein [Pedobacter sp. AK013]MBB6235544.1 hypothetical protein [Pedobacter sp. AK013]